MSDHCIVCAESLQFTAYGRCGHKETCSKCVCRLRTVLKDPRCAYCQQQLDQVFVTHYSGDYTTVVQPDEFDNLQARFSVYT
jgi:E3 ubiquitin-protein ligase ZNF598